MLFNVDIRGALLGVYLLTWSLIASAAENEAQTALDGQPNLEILEFLGQFETDQGNWIAPGELMQEEFKTLLSAAINAESEPATNAADSGTNN
ncbi:MAG: hypothetical protein ACI95C_001690 [Pseudohongiellaceae bacterium]|jgi:hypothetical protein